MEYQNLGNSGLKISKIIFGGMSIGSKGWSNWVIDDEEKSLDLLKKAYDVGIRTFDTADSYSNGKSEILIGKFLKKYNIKRSTVVILTKCFFVCDPENTPSVYNPTYVAVYPNEFGTSRKHIMDAVDGSVERLGTYIDVYQIHRFDKNTPREETMSALNDVVKSGKVRYIGSSSMKAFEFALYQFIAEKNGWTKFISMQNYYNLLYREEEREMIPFCNETGVGLIPWSPLAKGILARAANEKYATNRAKEDARIGSLFGTDNSFQTSITEIINRVGKVAKKRLVSRAIVSTAWVISKGACPIIGFSSEERIDEAVEAVKLKLTEEELKYLEEPYIPQPVLY